MQKEFHAQRIQNLGHTLKCVEEILVLVQSVIGIFVLMDLYLEKTLGRAMEFHMELVVDRILKFPFDGTIASNVDMITTRWRVLQRHLFCTLSV